MKEQNKNTLKIPQFPQKLPGSFWGITTFFNPQNYANKIENYQIFRNSSKKQGLKLLTVELAFGSKPCELKKKDAEILVQVRSDSVLWQKERLFNIGIKNLPEDCDKVALLDADIIFQNENWVQETSNLLEKYRAVQPFELAVRLGKKENSIEKKDYSAVYGILQDKSYKRDYEFGYAWAFRRDAIENIKTYDEMIIGSGDAILALSLYNKKEYLERFLEAREITGCLKNDILNWREKMYAEIRQSVYYTSGTIEHLYHGDIVNRIYALKCREQCLHDFDPNKDIKLNSYECWEWATQKPKLHNYIKNYFELRNEEGKNGIIKTILSYRNFPQKLFLDIDYFIGELGILMKNKNPKLYYFLRKCLKKQNKY